MPRYPPPQMSQGWGIFSKGRKKAGPWRRIERQLGVVDKGGEAGVVDGHLPVLGQVFADPPGGLVPGGRGQKFKKGEGAAEKPPVEGEIAAPAQKGQGQRQGGGALLFFPCGPAARGRKGAKAARGPGCGRGRPAPRKPRRRASCPGGQTACTKGSAAKTGSR